ncbi:unnamed protein product [Brassica oleracea var. botrytis]
MELLVVVRKKKFVVVLVNKSWEGPTNSSDNAKKIDSTVSEHDKALVMKNNLTSRVLGRPPPMSSSATSSETSSTSQSSVSSQEVSLRKEGRGYYRNPSYMNLTQSINGKKRRSTSILHLLVPKSLFEKKHSMSYNEDVNVKCCACSDPSCTQWSDLYPHAQVTRRNMWAKKLK